MIYQLLQTRYSDAPYHTHLEYTVVFSKEYGTGHRSTAEQCQYKSTDQFTYEPFHTLLDLVCVERAGMANVKYTVGEGGVSPVRTATLQDTELALYVETIGSGR